MESKRYMYTAIFVIARGIAEFVFRNNIIFVCEND